MINSVRNAVLTVTNKNNYGYISPSDFNLMAQNAQMELYEEYFSSYNKIINAENLRSSGTDYADINKTFAEAIEVFLVSDFLIPQVANNFYLPSLITTGNEAYMISKVMVYSSIITSGTQLSATPYQLNDASATFITDGVNVGDIAVNLSSTPPTATVITSINSETSLGVLNDIFINYEHEIDYVIYSSSAKSEAEKVTNGNIFRLTSSNLTSPSMIYPAYTNIGDIMTLYPTTIQGYGAVKADYFRYPKVPKWTYSSLSGGEPIFDQSQPDYQDFELPREDEYKLVTKILEYCGIMIRDIVVSQFGSAQQQHEQPTFSMQQ